MSLAIATRDLGLTLGRRQVLAGVSLAVPAGEVFGVLGPNGAGKTTTVRLLNGLLRPSSGSARVCGLDPASQGDLVRRRTGVLTESPALYTRLSARENLMYFAALGDAREPKALVERALARVGLSARADDLAGSFSKGMQQRLAIARAILHEPELLFLDEPTAGLDPESAERITALVADWRSRGHTVFLATHHLGDAERQCDRFAFYASGRVVAAGTRAELALLAGARPGVRITCLGPVPQGLGRVEGQELLLDVEHHGQIPGLVRAVVEAGGAVLRVEPTEPSLESLYFALVGREEAA